MWELFMQALDAPPRIIPQIRKLFAVQSPSYLLRTDKNIANLNAEDLMTTVTISLPESLKEFIDLQLATRGYGNVSEYFRSLLREAQKEEENSRLEGLLLEGLAGGADISATPEFWKDLKAEARHIADKHKVRKRS